MAQFYELAVSQIQRVTPQSVAVSFAIPDQLKDSFKYTAGQYITLKTEIDGSEVRRAYSICSSPNSGVLTVAIKEVPNGTFSTFANNTLKEGDLLEVHPPEGKFKLDKQAAATEPEHYAAFAAGSGITPILSMIRTVLESDTQNTFVLIYGNKTPAETMFKDELLGLREAYPSRFSLELIYSRSREDGAHFGRIMRSTVNFVMKNKYASKSFDSIYLCGPEPMIKEVTDALLDNHVEASNIYFELFTSNDVVEEYQEVLDGKTAITVVVDDESFEFGMEQDAIILDAALDEDIDAPHSCQGGICSSCIARVTTGTAVMRKNQILTDSEVAEGLILTCQAHPTSSKIVVDYDQV